MPVTATSQLPPFLTTVLRDRVEREGDDGYSLETPSSSSSTLAGRGRLGGPGTLSHARPDPYAGQSSTSSSSPSPSTRRNDRFATYGENGAKAGASSNHHHLPTTTTAAAAAIASSELTSLLVPPLNFDMVCSGGSSIVYRSGHPNERNFTFMSTLNLKTIIYLSSDDIRDNLQSWIDGTEGNVRLLHFRLNVNKEPFAEMEEEIVAQALNAILDRRNLPTLIHCNKGKYRVGVITGLIRRLQGWSMTSIFDEYARFAGSDRVADEEFIDMFSLSLVKPDGQYTPDWLNPRS